MTAAIEGVSGQQHASFALYTREITGTHFTVGWVGPDGSLDEPNISSAKGIDPGPSSPESVAIPTELPAHIVSVYWDLFWDCNRDKGTSVSNIKTNKE